jgi:tRNA threonylcarbamoyladenosine biosynthesis protein TsaB
MPAIVIGWDTATADLVVAATRDGEPVDERRLGAAADGRPRHAAELLGEVEAIVDRAGGWARVDAISVGVGPGSFTGLRIGLATARGLAQALHKPIVGVGTLDALGRGIRTAAQSRDRGVLAVLDARRGQAFAALYGTEGRELWPPFVAAPEQLAERVRSLPLSPVAAGSGALRFRAELEAAGAEILAGSGSAHRVSGRQVCLLGETGAPVPADSIRPIYLRPPDAELWLERDAR